MRSNPSRAGKFWTRELDDALRGLLGNMPIHEIAEHLGTVPGSIRWRAKFLNLNLNGLTVAVVYQPDKQDPAFFRAQDEAFIAVMTSAIKAGREHAPIGIDTTPGTVKPRYVPHRKQLPLVGSPAGSCAELGS